MNRTVLILDCVILILGCCIAYLLYFGVEAEKDYDISNMKTEISLLEHLNIEWERICFEFKAEEEDCRMKYNKLMSKHYNCKRFFERVENIIVKRKEP